MALPDIQKAAKHLKKNETSEAVTLLTEMVETFPAHATAHLLLARAYRKDKQYQEALASLARVKYWSSAEAAVKEELHRVVRAKTNIKEQAPEKEVASVGPSAADPQASSADVSSSPSNELVRDLQERLGPPKTELDEDIKDLNSLIHQLEGARIQPEPDFMSSEEEDRLEAGSQEEKEEVVSETLARIYVTQKEFQAAADTYEKLAVQHPERSDEFLEKARAIKEKAN